MEIEKFTEKEIVEIRKIVGMDDKSYDSNIKIFLRQVIEIKNSTVFKPTIIKLMEKYNVYFSATNGLCINKNKNLDSLNIPKYDKKP